MIHNEAIHPNVLMVDFDETPETRKIANLFPHVKYVNSSFIDVEQSEYDLAIVANESHSSLNNLERHLYVIAFGTQSLGRAFREEGSVDLEIEDRASRAQEFIENDDISPNISRLVTSTLIPLYRKESLHKGLTGSMMMYGHMAGMANRAVIHCWTPVVSDKKGVVLVGYLNRDFHASYIPELWRLPEVDDASMFEWVKALIERWKGMNPKVFADTVEWQRQEEYLTSNERTIADRISVLEGTLQKKQKELLVQIEAAQGELKKAYIKGDKGVRSLLTSKDEILKDEIGKTFEYLGFSVEDYDTTLRKLGRSTDKLQDLNVRFRIDGKKEWVAITEVKGYKGGAKLNDLFKLGGRYKNRYLKEMGEEPDAVWYVVNHDMETEPAKRQIALSTNPSEVETFAGDGGLVIDTYDLFKLKMKVERAELTKQAAVEMLVRQTGYFTTEQSKAKTSG